MKNMKRILVPTDFSQYAQNALEMAAYIAKIKEMSIKTIHVIQEPYVPLYTVEGIGLVSDVQQEYFGQLIETTREHLKKSIDTLKEKEIDIEYEVLKIPGGVAAEIVRQEADLIIMGKKGLNHEENSWTGSVTEKVIRNSSTPVITVGQMPSDYKIKNILFASDFNEPIIDPVVQRIIHLAEIFMAELHLVRINTRDDFISVNELGEFEEKLKTFHLKGLKVKQYYALTEEEGIKNYASEINADLIALCTHGRRGLAHLLNGSIAEDLSINSDIPVLTYNISPKKAEKAMKPLSRTQTFKAREKEKTDKERKYNSGV
jgi:nucleotide-binding universal stress UspA family protein